MSLHLHLISSRAPQPLRDARRKAADATNYPLVERVRRTLIDAFGSAGFALIVIYLGVAGLANALAPILFGILFWWNFHQ